MQHIMISAFYYHAHYSNPLLHLTLKMAQSMLSLVITSNSVACYAGRHARYASKHSSFCGVSVGSLCPANSTLCDIASRNPKHEYFVLLRMVCCRIRAQWKRVWHYPEITITEVVRIF